MLSPRKPLCEECKVDDDDAATQSHGYEIISEVFPDWPG
jgi:hypothetical protein